MPQVMITRRAFLGAKAETNAGTDSVPTAAANAIVTYNTKPTILESDMLEVEPMSGNLDLEAPIPGLFGAALSCETYMSTSGVAGTAVDYAPLLRGSGMGETVVAATSVTYKPISTFDGTSGQGLKALSLYFWMDGKLFKSIGSCGNVKLAMEVGKPGVWAFDFKGNYSAPTVVTLPAPTFANHVTPKTIRGISAIFTPSGGVGFTGVLRKLEWDNGCDVQQRPDANNSSGGYISAVIVNRKGKFAVTAEESETYTDGASNLNWWGKLTAQTAGAWAIGPIGTAVGDRINISMPKFGVGKVSFEPENGMGVLNIEGTPATNDISVGNDSFVLAIT